MHPMCDEVGTMRRPRRRTVMRDVRVWLTGCLMYLPQRFHFGGSGGSSAQFQFARALLAFLLFCLAFEWLFSTPSLPRSLSRSLVSPQSACGKEENNYQQGHRHHHGRRYSLQNSSFCIGDWTSDCFPRVQGICFSSDKVRICGKQPNLGVGQKQQELPRFMRFNGEQLTVPVVKASCDKGWHWISGLSLVADQRFLPEGKPNPHHEAEKLIPALLLAQRYKGPNASLHWFAAKSDVSVWAQGFLDAFNLLDKVRYHVLPSRTDDSICFEDAVLFSGPTQVCYIPDMETNAWLRTCVLNHCSIPSVNASWPVTQAVIMDRNKGPRQLANKHEIGDLLGKVLQVPVKHLLAGMGSFCDQVQEVSQDDFFVVPHGSQNVNFLFARPGAIVIEVFPYLFYNDALHNFTHATGIEVHPLMGLLPPGNMMMRFYSMFGWDICYNHVRWCKNYARRQAIYGDRFKLEQIIRSIQSQRSHGLTDISL